MTKAPEEVGGAAPTDLTPGGVLTRRAPATAFEVSLDNFTGPFDLLLGLISKHKLDVTEIALARVTDDFIAHIKAERAKPTGWDLSQATEVLLAAATPLDLKAARLLPQSGPEDEEDLALLEARDLLFAAFEGEAQNVQINAAFGIALLGESAAGPAGRRRLVGGLAGPFTRRRSAMEKALRLFSK